MNKINPKATLRFEEDEIRAGDQKQKIKTVPNAHPKSSVINQNFFIIVFPFKKKGIRASPFSYTPLRLMSTNVNIYRITNIYHIFL